MSRTCACPRKESLEGRRSDCHWYSRACAKAWSRTHPGKPLSAAYSTPVVRPRRPGAKLPYRTFIDGLSDLDLDATDRMLVELWARECVPAKQRARL